jgi:PAS domain S-box-containing protein
MDEPAVRTIALLISDREKSEKIARFLSRRKAGVKIFDQERTAAPGSAECVIAEAALLDSGGARELLDASVALIVLGNMGKSQKHLQNSPLLRIMPARSSSTSLYGAMLQLCAVRDLIFASRTVVNAVQNQLRTLLSSVPDIVYILDERGNFIYLNESAVLLGYEPSELIGKHFSIIIHPEDKPNISRDIVVEKIRQANKFPDIPPKLFDERRSGQRMTRDLEVRLVHKDGHVVYALVNAYGERNFDMPLLSDVVGQNPQTIGVVHDVSAMHFYQQSLEDSLAAKERLLREIHHRVKTNLQLVASLAHLKQTDGASSASAEVLRELEAQIKSIALVHEALYQSEQVDRVSAREFFAQFCHAAEEALETVGSTVHLRLSADDCSLDPDRLVPLSLALLELLGGAYQTAYEKRAEVTVLITFRCADGKRRVLEVQGEGIMRKADSPIMRALLKHANADFEVIEGKSPHECCRLTIERQY